MCVCVSHTMEIDLPAPLQRLLSSRSTTGLAERLQEWLELRLGAVRVSPSPELCTASYRLSMEPSCMSTTRMCLQRGVSRQSASIHTHQWIDWLHAKQMVTYRNAYTEMELFIHAHMKMDGTPLITHTNTNTCMHTQKLSAYEGMGVLVRLYRGMLFQISF